MSEALRPVLREIVFGSQGLNKGVSFGNEAMDKVYGGITKGNAYVIGAPPAVGKTTVADNFFFYPLVEAALAGRDIKIHYFAFDNNREDLFGRMLLRYLYVEHGIVLPGGIMDLFGRRYPEGVISQDTFDKIRDLKPRFSDMDRFVRFHTDPMSPQEIYQILEDEAMSKGETEMLANGETVFRWHDPLAMVVGILDHAGKLVGFSAKDKIDEMSHFANRFRSLYNGTFVMLQQNRHDIVSPERVKSGQFFPLASDYKDSKNSIEDFPTVMTLMNPAKAVGPKTSDRELHRVQTDFLGGIELAKYKSVLTTMTGTKNRNGPDDVHIRLAVCKPAFYAEHWNDKNLNTYLKWQDDVTRQVIPQNTSS